MQKVSIFNYSVTNAASKKTCDVYIDGAIVDAETQEMYELYFGDTTLSSFKSVRDQVNQFISEGCTTVNVRVNSQGGSVIEAFAIKDYLDSLTKKNITVNKIGNGLVASAATLIVSGEGSTISPNSWFMVHNASGAIWGNVNEIEQYAKTIRDFNNQILDHYVDTTGLSKASLQSMMDNETWITGKDAVAMGFVSALTTSESTITNQIKPENWMFQNKSVLAAYNSIIKTTPQNLNEMDFKKLINDALVTANASFKQILDEAFKGKEDDNISNTLIKAMNKSFEDAFEPMNQGVIDLVNEAVTERLKDMDTKVNTAVENVIAEKIKDVLTASVLEEKLKPITDNIKSLQDAIIDDAGSANPEPVPAGEKPTALNHPGVKW